MKALLLKQVKVNKESFLYLLKEWGYDSNIS